MVAHLGMTTAKLLAQLRRMFPELQVEPGYWTAQVDELEVYVVADEHEDRLRILVPVARADRFDADLLWVLLLANFQLALDARYAVQDGLVWCVFVHRLSWLTEVEVENALCNVLSLARNTGSSFSSSDLVLDG